MADIDQWKSTRDVFLSTEPLKKSYLHAASRYPLKCLTLGEALEEAAEKCPDKNAFLVPDHNQSLTYSQLLQESEVYAKSFLSLGLQKGDVVTVCCLHDKEPVPLLYGTTSIGGIFMMPYAYRPFKKYLIDLLNKVSTKVLILDISKGLLNVDEETESQDLQEAVHQLFPDLDKSGNGKVHCSLIPGLEFVFIHDSSKQLDISKYPTLKTLQDLGKSVSKEELKKRTTTIDMSDPAVIFTSTGTTGSPKAILQSHKSVVNVVYFWLIRKNPLKKPYVVAVMSFDLDDVLVIFNMASAVVNWEYKVTCVTVPTLRKYTGGSDTGIEAMATCKCTHADLWAHIWEDAIKHGYLEKYDLQNLYGGMSGAQILSKETVEKFTKCVPEFVNMYGTTESFTITSNFPDDPNWDRRLKTVGYPIAHIEVKVVNDEGFIIPINTPGEIHVKSPLMFEGYVKDKELTQECLSATNWYKTGDIVRMDEDGFIHFIGRKKDAIRFKKFAEVVYPGVIENTAKAHDKISDAQCIGVTSDLLFGDLVCLCVILQKDETMTEKELQDYCEKHLIERDVPDIYIFMENFPRIGSRQKVPKEELTKMVLELLKKKKTSMQ